MAIVAMAQSVFPCSRGSGLVVAIEGLGVSFVAVPRLMSFCSFSYVISCSIRVDLAHVSKSTVSAASGLVLF